MSGRRGIGTAARALLVVCLAAVSGCQPVVAYVAALLQTEQKVPARYTLPKAGTVLVLVEDTHHLVGARPVTRAVTESVNADLATHA